MGLKTAKVPIFTHFRCGVAWFSPYPVRRCYVPVFLLPYPLVFVVFKRMSRNPMYLVKLIDERN